MKPLSDVIIKELENNNLQLPSVYREFLRMMGKGAGDFMKGSSVFYPEIISLKQWTDELIIENDLMPLKKDSFPFWMHQGYQVAYFNLDEGADPPVYFFSEGDKSHFEFYLKEDSLTNFFIAQLEMSYGS